MAQTIDQQTPEQLAGPDRDASSALGFHARLGIDDRAVFKGAQRNDAISNINAFPALLRARDDEYYSEMPMNTDVTDPSNVQVDAAKTEQLRTVLNARIEEAAAKLRAAENGAANDNATDNNTAANINTLNNTTAPLFNNSAYLPKGWAGIKYDLHHWNERPSGRLRYFLTRDNRMVYLVVFIIALMAFGYIFNSMMK
jgi:hypothetical protein